ncbi:MAG: 30S ribosomal protein S13 [Candidatus Thermoplasmatota archaeon]|nr:30S ribosomal protein S13 [Candidatus Thermoplasmatota archaeon]
MAEENNQAPEDEGPDDDFLYIVRIANTDLDGNKPVYLALTAVKGVGSRVATAVTDHCGVDRHVKIGSLPEEQIEQLSEAVSNVDEIVPPWMLNRRKDVSTGEDLHLLRMDLDQQLREDLNRLKKIRSYRGIRHEQGQKVRGQRTRSNGRSGLAMGVSRQREQAK